MNTIKYLFLNQFKIISILGVSITLSIVLLMIRMKLMHSFFYLFLVWNLFLAIIPYSITTYLSSKVSMSKYALILWFGVWLLFLPNAPYIITDLLHLRLSDGRFMWLDVLVVSSFAFNGLLFLFLSVLDMQSSLKQYISSKNLSYFIKFILFITGFGIYLGRFLRYNSWEIIQHPLNIFTDVKNIITQPQHHIEAWIFTLIFGVFLNIGFWMFKEFYKPST